MTEPAPGKSGSLRERYGSAATPENWGEIQKHLKELLSDDYVVRAASVGVLEKHGEEAAEAIVEALLKKADHPHALSNYSDALGEIGKPAINPLLRAIEGLVEYKQPVDVYVLESLVDLLGLLHDRRAAAPLLQQVGNLNRAIKRNHHQQLVHCCEAAKVRIHRHLVGFGEKGGLDDLLEMLGDGRRRVPDGVVDALARVGDKRALVPLVRLYGIEDPVSYSGAQYIKEAVREIARRENVTSEDRMFRKELTADERTTVERLFPKTRNGNGNGKH